MSCYIKVFAKRDPIFAQEPGLLAEEETIEKQLCPNWRCRGNVDDHCVYHSGQYNICCDKEAVNDSFFCSD